MFDNINIFNPPKPVRKFYYRCDNKFHLEDLITLYESYDAFAIVLMSGKRTEFYVHSKNETKKLNNISTKLPNQHKTGGQSAQRFGRIRDEMINVYVKKIVEMMIKCYTVDGIFNFAGVIVSGPAGIKESVTDLDLFKQYFAKHVTKTVTTGEICDNTIRHVISESQDIFCSESDESEMEELLYDPVKFERLIFGEDNVKNEYNVGNLEQLFVSKNYYKQNEFKSCMKTKISVVCTSSFVSKYGNMVGVLYY